MDKSSQRPGVDETWVAACQADDLEEGTAIALDVFPPIAVFHVEGQFFATDDTCTHAQSSLAEGYIEGATVECEMHFAKFCIRSGAALSPPAVTPLATYRVHVADGTVFVDVSSRQPQSSDQSNHR